MHRWRPEVGVLEKWLFTTRVERIHRRPPMELRRVRGKLLVLMGRYPRKWKRTSVPNSMRKAPAQMMETVM